MAHTNLSTPDEVIDFIHKFRESHVTEYFEETREYASLSYGRYADRGEIIQGMRSLASNLEENLIPKIPENFPSPKALFRTIGWFKQLSKEKYDLAKQILDNKFSDDFSMVPGPIIALERMAKECLDFSEYVMEQDCVKDILGQSLNRVKDQKFGVLDAPNLLNEDLKEAFGVLGASALYVDIDNFKKLNSKYTESVVDDTILPEYQRMLTDLVDQHGFVYAEGGDEVVILLRNFSKEMASAYAENIRATFDGHQFKVDKNDVNFTVSIGVAHAQIFGLSTDLVERANKAENESKKNGRNRVEVG